MQELIEVIINSISQPIVTAARAPGKMRAYELILGSMQLLIFVFSLVLFRIGYEAWISFAIAIFINLVMMLVRLILVRILVGLPLGKFATKTIFPILGMTVVSFCIIFGIKILIPTGFFSSL